MSEEDIKKFQSLKEIIEELQKTITEHSDYLSERETRTRQFLIDPLLRELGWDVLNPSAVQLEFGVKDGKGTKQMDYALMLDDCPIAIIQAKHLNYKQSLARVAKITKNILGRAKLTNIHYIIITDGNRWNIYEYEVLKEPLIMELNESSEVSALRVMQVWKWKSNLASGSPKEATEPVLDFPDDKIKDAPAVPPALASAIKKGDNALPIEQLYLEYWKALKSSFEGRNNGIKFRKPHPQCWMGFAVGRSNFGIHTWASRDKKYICVGLTVDGEHGKTHFNLLQESMTEIQKKMGVDLEWQENPKENNIRVYQRNIDLENRLDWGKQHQWLYDNLELFYEVFKPRIDALKKRR